MKLYDTWIPARALRAGQTVRIADGTIYWMAADGFKTYNPTRYRKENTMKPGPFKSSTHGPIDVSMRARELLAANQLAIQTAVGARDYNAFDQAVSRSRGELARYVGELESFAKSATQASRFSFRTSQTLPQNRTHVPMCEPPPPPAPLKSVSLQDLAAPMKNLCLKNYETAVSLLADYGVERVSQVPGHLLPELLDKIRAALNPFAPPPPMKRGREPRSAVEALDDKLDALKYTLETNFEIPKEYMNVKTEDKAEEAVAPVQTRVQLIDQAAAELTAATKALQNIDDRRRAEDGTDAIGRVVIDTSPWVPYELREGISKLVREQWPQLVADVIYRAEMRVWEAEAAMARLLGSEPTAAKPRRPGKRKAA